MSVRLRRKPLINSAPISWLVFSFTWAVASSHRVISRQDGDIMLGALFPIHSKGTSLEGCGPLQVLCARRKLLSIIWMCLVHSSQCLTLKRFFLLQKGYEGIRGFTFRFRRLSGDVVVRSSRVRSPAEGNRYRQFKQKKLIKIIRLSSVGSWLILAFVVYVSRRSIALKGEGYVIYFLGNAA